MPSLQLRTALTQIEQAIARALRLALQVRTQAADVAAVRALPVLGDGGTMATRAGTLVYVSGLGVNVEWSKTSTAADDGATVFRPSEVSADVPGRWLITTSRVQTGYVRAVNFWQGETRKKEFQARILAERPSLAIVWETGKNDPRSTTPGAIFDYPCEFSVWCIDENMRPDFEAFFGSDLPFDVPHPGVLAMLGDVKKILADENKRRVDQNAPNGGPLGLHGGVKLLQIGAEDIEDADIGLGYLVASLGVVAIGSIENPDADEEHTSVDGIAVQQRITELHGEESFDPRNYLVDGYSVAPQFGLTTTPQPGHAVVGGVAVASAPSAITFAAEADTYLFLAVDGSLHRVAVGRELPPPAAMPGALLVGVVSTDSSGVVAFRYLTATSPNFGSPFPAGP